MRATPGPGAACSLTLLLARVDRVRVGSQVVHRLKVCPARAHPPAPCSHAAASPPDGSSNLPLHAHAHHCSQRSLSLPAGTQLVGDPPPARSEICARGGTIIESLAPGARLTRLTLRGGESSGGQGDSESGAGDATETTGVHIQADLRMEDCDVRDCAGICVYVAAHTGSNVDSNVGPPCLVRCGIHGGGDVGVWLCRSAELRDCQVSNCALSCIEVSGGADPLLTRCTVWGSREAGVHVYEGGLGLYEDCLIYGNGAFAPPRTLARFHHGREHLSSSPYAPWPCAGSSRTRARRYGRCDRARVCQSDAAWVCGARRSGGRRHGPGARPRHVRPVPTVPPSLGLANCDRHVWPWVCTHASWRSA